ncbi:MAG: Lrp/AsnC family transcriptional regulator, partial [archaeon]
LELAKNARLSDRELASKLKTSQPTITRLRSRMMEDKYIDRFVILPNLGKLGLNFWSVTTMRPSSTSSSRKILQWAHDSPPVLLAGEGDGPRMHSILIESIHADFSQYQEFIRDFKDKFAGQITDIHSFFMDSKDVTKFYHWHSVLENRLIQLKVEMDTEKKLSRGERFRQALEKIPNPLERIQNPLRPRERGDVPKEMEEDPLNGESKRPAE